MAKDRSKAKLYRMCDEDVVIAYSRKDAIEWHLREYGISEDELDVRKLSKKEMEKFVWWEIDDIGMLEKWIDELGNITVGKRAGYYAAKLPHWYAMKLYVQGESEIPNIFSSTEY